MCGIGGTRSIPLEPQRVEHPTSTLYRPQHGRDFCTRAFPRSAPPWGHLHIIIMEVIDPTSAHKSGQKARRPRAARACNLCRVKKYKCDELHPCTHCKSMSTLPSHERLWHMANWCLQLARSNVFTRGRIRRGGGTRQSTSPLARLIRSTSGRFLTFTSQICSEPGRTGRAAISPTRVPSNKILVSREARLRHPQ